MIKKCSFILNISMLCFCLIGCKNGKTLSQLKIQNFNFAEKNYVQKEIVKNDEEFFFNKITPIDVALQLKNNDLLKDRLFLEKYKQRLVESAMNFSPEEKTEVTKQAQLALESLSLLNKELPLDITFCKIDVNHYGEDVYYTRGKNIYIPSNVLVSKSYGPLKNVILHEIWHIWAEQYPVLKDSLYGLIGFKKHHFNIEYPKNIKDLLLTNPDGAHYDYGILLNNSKLALPVIISKSPKYDPAIFPFYNYIKFELYGISANGKLEVNQDLSSKLSDDEHNSFFQQIGTNTGYIIHPDEIVADNFMHAVNTNISKNYTEFDVKGQKLLKDITRIIKQFKP
jgi:hypothetical protein